MQREVTDSRPNYWDSAPHMSHVRLGWRCAKYLVKSHIRLMWMARCMAPHPWREQALNLMCEDLETRFRRKAAAHEDPREVSHAIDCLRESRRMALHRTYMKGTVHDKQSH